MTAQKIKSALSSFFLLKGIIAAGLEQIKFEWNKTWHYFVGEGGYIYSVKLGTNIRIWIVPFYISI